MKPCPAIIVALQREIGELVRGWRKTELPNNVFLYTNGFGVAACAGMGAARVSLAVEATLAAKPVTLLISAGLAGACDPALRVGEIVRAGVVIDSRTGEQFADPQHKQVLVTSPIIASVREKQRLFASYGACAVDMESATVARIARAHNLAFGAIKAISDDATFELEGLSRFATADGQFREAAFAAYTAMRPALWGKVFQLAGDSKRATKELTNTLAKELEWWRERA